MDARTHGRRQNYIPPTSSGDNIYGCQVINLQKNIVFFCLKIVLTFTNSLDPDEMPIYAAFHLGLHCLQKCPFRGIPYTKR